MDKQPLPPTLRTRVALVTGGARRVGKAIAIELARRGARVAVHANSSLDEAYALCELLEEEFGADAAAFEADLAEDGAPADLVERVTRHFARFGEAGDAEVGRIDILVNSAAVWPKQPLEELTGEDARRCLQVNTVAPLLLAKEAGLRMAEQATGGVILNLGDVATAPDGVPPTGYAGYHASKAAIPGITRALAIELAERNPRVRVNAVLPGPVICEHLPDEPEDPPARKEFVRKAALITTPNEGAYGRAEHVAHAVAMLVENPFITGVALPVDGGTRLKR
ncbi:Glucose 1-dehydrogenase 2 [Planctomycetes bacterium MalM25]|nr:Glucose 1-dehydrogenase 2 [Planctomycetes bacterium MalM25]